MKRKMRRNALAALALLLALCLPLALAGCSKPDNAAAPSSTAAEAPPTDTSEPAPATEPPATPAPTEEPAPTEAPAEPLDLSDYMHTRTGRFYSRYQGGKMYMKYEMDYDGTAYTVVSATSGSKTYTETVTDGVSSRAIMDGEYLYAIDDANKSVYKMSLKMADPQTMMDTLLEEGDVDIANLQTGTRTIDGKTYDTETWEMEGMSSTLCFDGEELAYIIGQFEDVESVMRVVECSDKVDDSLFELPAGYEVMAF